MQWIKVASVSAVFLLFIMGGIALAGSSADRTASPSAQPIATLLPASIAGQARVTLADEDDHPYYRDRDWDRDRDWRERHEWREHHREWERHHGHHHDEDWDERDQLTAGFLPVKLHVQVTPGDNDRREFNENRENTREYNENQQYNERRDNDQGYNDQGYNDRDYRGNEGRDYGENRSYNENPDYNEPGETQQNQDRDQNQTNDGFNVHIGR